MGLRAHSADPRALRDRGLGLYQPRHALGMEGSLTPDEVYSIVAYLLFINDVIEEDVVLDQDSLPKIEMPNRNNFARVPDWFPGQPRLEGYPY